jgi:hypothetical protein
MGNCWYLSGGMILQKPPAVVRNDCLFFLWIQTITRNKWKKMMTRMKRLRRGQGKRRRATHELEMMMMTAL